ncbi:MAG: hypothetical protein CVU87_02695 [Firmicutes bacterium HGW-Firmicutes-12]|jgi:hypothetical protein|nr:MAG: hypothetical protein CVU87_02695 [Firmicutes bacterium HGW-Firmicutes-12]
MKSIAIQIDNIIREQLAKDKVNIDASKANIRNAYANYLEDKKQDWTKRGVSLNSDLWKRFVWSANIALQEELDKQDVAFQDRVDYCNRLREEYILRLSYIYNCSQLDIGSYVKSYIH